MSGLQRIVLLSYDMTTQRISLRHYCITAAPSGVSKGVKSLVNQRAVPDLSNVQVGCSACTCPVWGAGQSSKLCRKDA